MLLGKQGVRTKMSLPSQHVAAVARPALPIQPFLWLLAALLCLCWAGVARASLAGPLCGNGVLDAGEVCDDGNRSETDSCLTDCQLATCGDGFLHSGVEQCDDGNAVDTDGCSNTCIRNNAVNDLGATGEGHGHV